MTETSGTHVPVEDLAAYAAGDLDGAAAVSVEAHVLLCADCRNDLDAIRSVSDALAAVPAVTMPDDVAARIDDALLAERGEQPEPADAGSSTEPAPGPGDATVLPMRRRRSPGVAALSAAAAVTALVAAVGLSLARDGGGGAGDDRAMTAGTNGGDRARQVFHSGADYASTTIGQMVPSLLSGKTPESAGFRASGEQSGTAAPGGAPAAPVADTLSEPELSGAALDACLRGLNFGAPVEPIALDYARFEGKPALIVVLPRLRQGNRVPNEVDVWVVGPKCSATDADAFEFQRLRL